MPISSIDSLYVWKEVEKAMFYFIQIDQYQKLKFKKISTSMTDSDHYNSIIIQKEVEISQQTLMR